MLNNSGNKKVKIPEGERMRKSTAKFSKKKIYYI